MMAMHETNTTATLEILARTRASLTTGPFSFHDWTRCTCGHLYIGAAGSRAERLSDVRSPSPDTAYAAALIDVARALSGDARRFSGTGRRWYDRRSPAALAARWLSDYTMRRARKARDTVKRADAIAVIDEAIARIEALEPRRTTTKLVDAHERELVA
jgi:hypothetical protein